MFVQAFLFISLTGFDIMKKVDEQPVPKSSKSTVKMVIKKGGAERERKILIYTKSEGEKRYTAMKFLAPSDVKGTAFLQIVEGDKTVQYLYLPSLRRKRRISSAQEKTSFMGSEMTYEDMKRKNPENYKHKIIKEDENFWVIETTPKEGIESQYSKAISWVRKKDYVVVKSELYDREGKLFKVIQNEDIRKINGYIIPMKTVIKNVQNGNETLMVVEDINVDLKLPKKYFSPGLLGKW